MVLKSMMDWNVKVWLCNYILTITDNSFKLTFLKSILFSSPKYNGLVWFGVCDFTLQCDSKKLKQII